MSFYGFMKGIAGWAFKLAFPTKVIGPKKLEKKKTVLAVNHLSNMDPIIVGCKLKPRLYFWGKKELFKRKIPAWFFKNMGVVPIDRSGADIASIKIALTLLKNDNIFMLFPEGTRNKGNEDEMLQLKNGLVMLAVKSQAPIRLAMFWKKPRFLKKNYLFVGEEFDLSQFYGQRLSNDVLTQASRTVEQKFEDLHAKMIATLKEKGVIKS
ncbi:MAG: 1-acyl-sn-glycerol-3-phosphate acyltransferase [Clostridiales bacterium]|nr:1-acyl-sn-glycerol-3-phosphate acyltransferase [Clostridiales bacterium]